MNKAAKKKFWTIGEDLLTLQEVEGQDRRDCAPDAWYVPSLNYPYGATLFEGSHLFETREDAETARRSRAYKRLAEIEEEARRLRKSLPLMEREQPR